MKQRTLHYPSQERLRELFYYEDAQLKRRSGLGRKFLKLETKKKYRGRRIDGHYISHHTLVWIYFNGDIPEGMEVDHVNRDSRDDRLENLRLATPSQNRGFNKSLRADNTSGFRGVTRHHGKWRAQINETRLGRFDTKEEAAAAYQQAAAELHGAFAGAAS